MCSQNVHCRFAAGASLVLVAALALEPAAVHAQVVRSEAHSFRVVRLVEGLEHPWALAFLPDGRLLVTERPGRLRIVGKDGRLVSQPVSGLPAIAAYGILRNRVARMSLEVGIVSEGLMSRFSKVGPKSEGDAAKA